jgi:pyruvate-formate lyase-activating enzyme
MTDSPRRSTTSICDVCLAGVPAEIASEGADVFLRKQCPEHGTRKVPLSSNGADFLKLDDAFHRMFPPTGEVADRVNAYFFITNACNQNCPYCLTEANRYAYFETMAEEDFARLVALPGGSKVGLIGGEPLRHAKLLRFAEIVAAAGKTLVVFTNGIALADPDLAASLSRACPRIEIRLAFEGFDEGDYRHLPNPRNREAKLAALGVLAAAGVPVYLGHTVLPGEDADAARSRIGRLVEYAMAHDFVKGVTIQGVVALGAARGATVDDSMAVDRLMDRVVGALPVPIPRTQPYVVQRLVYFAAWLFGLPVCAYVQTLVLFRAGSRWVGLDHFFDCGRLADRLDRRIGRGLASRFRTALGVGIDLLVAARLSRLPSLFRLGIRIARVFVRRYDLAGIPASVLPIVASSECDPYLFDAAVARRCEKGVNSTVQGSVRSELCSQMLIRHVRERRLADAGGPAEPAVVGAGGRPGGGP